MGIFPSFFAALLLALPTFSWADRILSEREIVARCYAQLTGQRLPVSDSLWQQLNSKSATQICLSLINDVQLGPDGTLTQSSNPVHRRILKQFHDLHRDWFPAHWAFNNSLPDNYFGTVDVYDAAEPSLFVTLSLFSQSAFPYQNVLRGYNSLIAVRDTSTLTADAYGTSGFPRASRSIFGETDPSQMLPFNLLNTNAVTGQDSSGNYFSLPARLVQLGALIGVQVSNSDTPTPLVWTNNFTPSAQLNPPGIMSPQSFHQSYGGGALGSAPFLLLNFGHSYDYVANGSNKLPRRAIMAAMNTFMCLAGPFTRDSDVTPFLVSDADTAAAPFRRSSSCLRCHASLDNAALTLRNLQLGGSANIVALGGVRSPAMVVSAGADAGVSPNFWPSDPVPGFNRTAPQGRLYFRSITGNLIDQSVGNLDGLGTAMSSTDDFYACAASRYFKYFTGVNVQLFDPLDPANQSIMANMSVKDEEYRQYVLGLGKELKATQSLKGLIKRILQSSYYRLAAYGR